MIEVRIFGMVCTWRGPLGQRCEARMESNHILPGWRLWYSERDGLGDKALKQGEAFCPGHSEPAMVSDAGAKP